jgi:predicted metal-dependent enzyme (double-stranded beta helix superfamily)
VDWTPSPAGTVAEVAVLREFVETCRSALDAADVADAPEVAERVAAALRPLLADADVLSAEVEALRPPGGGPAVVHRSDDLTVLGLAVPAGFVSPVHDHTIWAVVGIYAGDEDNVFYRRGDDGITETGRAVLRCGEVLALPPDAVHRIANSGTDTMRAVHVYGGDLFATHRSQWDDETGEQRPFGSAR